MAGRFHSLRISDVTRETADAVSISFDVPPELREVFLYKPGQHITVKMNVNGSEQRRNYSLCSSPVLGEPMRIAIKRVHDGAVSQWLNEYAKPGMDLEIYPPMGNFTKEMSASHTIHYLMFVGGSGITPVISLVKSLLHVEPNSRITMFYANRNASSIIFREQLKALSLKHEASGDRLQASSFRLIHVLEDNADASITSYIGRMDVPMVQRVIADNITSFDNAEAFVCGPGVMMDNVIEVLQKSGMENGKIHREHFIMDSAVAAEALEATGATEDVVVKRTVKIRLYGDEFEFEVEPDETILMAAQRANLDPPYACQIGACCTCRAKIMSGRVKMDEREALSDEEIADGYALTCQSHPLTDGVVADYDK